MHAQSTYMYLIRTACHAALCTKVSVKSLLDISTTLYMMVCYISSNHGNVTFVLLETNLPGIGMSHISFLNSWKWMWQPDIKKVNGKNISMPLTQL